MLEVPESAVFAAQMNGCIQGKAILRVEANHTPHKLVWFFGDPLSYHGQLAGKALGPAQAQGGNVELQIQDMRLLFQDGAAPRYLAPGEKRPTRHQLLVELEDGSGFYVLARMYGGVCAYREGENDNRYYLAAKNARSPLGDGFDAAHFAALCQCEGFGKLSAKAFLATGQRIPGLGNGSLQDILWRARLHPKRKMGALDSKDLAALFASLKDTLAQMARLGGRSTERDFFGAPGGYPCVLAKDSLGKPCPACGAPIQKETYLGGTVYLCPGCQPK